MTRAILGGRVGNIPAPDGDFAIQIPERTEDGDTFKSGGRGMPTVFGEERGDEYIMVKIKLPKELIEEERMLLSQFWEVKDA